MKKKETSGTRENVFCFVLFSQDLIEMIVNLKASVEKQAKKQSDLEDYIDSLLMKVIQQAPDLLQKNSIMEKKYGSFIK